MKLPHGITGFYEKKAPPETDYKQFKQSCYMVALMGKGKLIEERFTVITSFYNIKLESKESFCYLLLNKYYPYIAFATKVEFMDITFMDEPKLADYFTPFYQIATKKELNQPVCLTTLESTLNRVELTQITFWKPETYGEVIFNYWD